MAAMRQMIGGNIGAFTSSQQPVYGEGYGPDATQTVYDNPELRARLAQMGAQFGMNAPTSQWVSGFAIQPTGDGRYTMPYNISVPGREADRYSLVFNADGSLSDVRAEKPDDNSWSGFDKLLMAAGLAGIGYAAAPALMGGAGAGGGVGAGAIEGAVGIPELGMAAQTGLEAGGVGAGAIGSAAGLPELGLVPQTGLGAGWAAPITASPISSLGPAATWGDKLTYLTQGLGGAAAGAAGGAGGSNWLTSALRLAPLAGLALGGKPSLPNPPATDPQANIDAGVKSINDLFANDKRAPIYKQIYDDSYGLQSSRLDENRQDTLRKLRFGLARGGLTGGSADVSAHGLEQREFGRALSDASTAAQGQADQVRANDEKTRLNLIAQMRAGLDSADATQSALTQMADNANAARAQTRYDALDSYMGAVAPTINNFQVRSGQQAAQQLYNTRFPQNRISLSGRSGTIVG